jgi:hypothetical protein
MMTYDTIYNNIYDMCYTYIINHSVTSRQPFGYSQPFGNM